MQLFYKEKKTEEEILKEAQIHKGISLSDEGNLLFNGDNFIALSVLLSSQYRGNIDLIYIDPPFATNNNFVVGIERTSTISNPKNGTAAYSDKLLGSDYLEFLRKRLVLMRELLSNEGSIYLHIDYKIGHYVKIIMDEIFGEENFINDITRVKGNPKNFSRKAFGNQKDLILYYAKNKGSHIFNHITEELTNDDLEKKFKKIDENGRRYNTVPVHAPGESMGDTGMEWKGIMPPEGRHWRTSRIVLDELDEQGLIEWSKKWGSTNEKIFR